MTSSIMKRMVFRRPWSVDLTFTSLRVVADAGVTPISWLRKKSLLRSSGGIPRAVKRHLTQIENSSSDDRSCESERTGGPPSVAQEENGKSKLRLKKAEPTTKRTHGRCARPHLNPMTRSQWEIYNQQRRDGASKRGAEEMGRARDGRLLARDDLDTWHRSSPCK